MSLVDTNDGRPMGLAVIPQNPAALDNVQDPAAVMVALVDQARTMLAQATGMEGLADVIEWKSRAEAIRVYTQQKDMGHEAELSAAEIVRRAERRIGQLIREGQAAGEVATRGDETTGWRGKELQERGQELKMSPSSMFSNSQAMTETYALADNGSDEDFEKALAEGKAEGNLSRANIVRKVKGEPPVEAPRNLPLAQRTEQIRTLAAKNYTSPQIADEIRISAHRVREIAKSTGIDITADAVFGGKFRQIDANEVMGKVVFAAMPEPVVLARIAYSELDHALIPEWVSSLEAAIKSLQAIKSSLKKELTRDQL